MMFIVPHSFSGSLHNLVAKNNESVAFFRVFLCRRFPSFVRQVIFVLAFRIWLGTGTISAKVYYSCKNLQKLGFCSESIL